MRYDPEIAGCSLVLIGSFNPAIINPDWLFAHSAEPKVSPDEYKVEVILPDISNFRIQDRTYTVSRDRFEITSAVAPWVRLPDTLTLIFGRLLKHTPVRAFGINFHIHYRVPSLSERTRIGRVLAPIAPWGAFGARLDTEKPELTGGLATLTMREVESEEKLMINTNVSIEPSVRFTEPTGIYIQVNFHHDILSSDDQHSAAFAIDAIGARFGQLERRADEIFAQLMEV